jgi:hypothetical protein
VSSAKSAKIKQIGFADPERPLGRQRSTALVQLVATAALALSITIVVTAVFIGLAVDRPLSAPPGVPVAMLRGAQLTTLSEPSVSAMAVPHALHLRRSRAAL